MKYQEASDCASLTHGPAQQRRSADGTLALRSPSLPTPARPLTFGPAWPSEHLLGNTPPFQGFPLMFILIDKHRDSPLTPRLAHGLGQARACAELLICAVGWVLSRFQTPVSCNVPPRQKCQPEGEGYKVISSCSELSQGPHRRDPGCWSPGSQLRGWVTLQFISQMGTLL